LFAFYIDMLSLWTTSFGMALPTLWSSL